MSNDNNNQKVRVAIYTRKSIEDAEDKAFNSIDAQRSMCESFIAAKATEGWIALPDRFDDYGFTGANLSRPGFQKLMEYCEKGLVDRVISIRLDRVSRSLKDYSFFEERLKELGVGYTSVTEPFVDTSSPVGELFSGLIVMFASWERKVIQERIRKHCRTAIENGYFIGGIAPYGYKVENQVLVPDPDAAANVPHIFKLYLELRSLKKVAAKLGEEGIERGPGKPWTVQSLHGTLRNIRYLGEAKTASGIVKGKQPALITRDLWEKVQKALKDATHNLGSERVSSPETQLYQGLVFCGHCKKAMSYHWSRKDTTGVRKYGYFICQQDSRQGVSTCPVRHVSVTVVQDTIERELESIMLASMMMLVAAAKVTTFTPDQIVTGLRRHTFWTNLTMADRRVIFRLFVKSITIFKDAIELRVRLPDMSVADELRKSAFLPAKPAPDDTICIDDEGCLFVRIPVAFRTVSGRKEVIKLDVDGASASKSTKPDLANLAHGPVIQSIARGIAWMKMIDEGKVKSVKELARLVDTDRHFVVHTLRLATLSPRIVRAALKGELPDGFSLGKVRGVTTDDWAEQERLLGFKEVG